MTPHRVPPNSLTESLTESTRRQWQALGLSVSSGADSTPVQLAVEDPDEDHHPHRGALGGDAVGVRVETHQDVR